MKMLKQRRVVESLFDVRGGKSDMVNGDRVSGSVGG